MLRRERERGDGRDGKSGRCESLWSVCQKWCLRTNHTDISIVKCFLLGRNTASLAFKSRLAFPIGIHVAFLALISQRNKGENVTCIPMEKRDAI